MHLVGFIIRIYHDVRPPECKIRNPSIIQRIDQEGFVWRCSCLLLSSIQELPLMSSSPVICQTTGPKPLPRRVLHIVRSRASSFNWQYPLLSLRSSSSFLRLLHLLFTSICPFIFPSITCFRRQFLPKMWPIQLAFRFLISCRIFLCSLTLSNTSLFLTWSVQLICLQYAQIN